MNEIIHVLPNTEPLLNLGVVYIILYLIVNTPLKSTTFFHHFILFNKDYK